MKDETERLRYGWDEGFLGISGFLALPLSLTFLDSSPSAFFPSLFPLRSSLTKLI
jgi:hypothetical protein